MDVCFYLFKFILGLTSGLVPLYLIEITPNKYRGTAGTLHQVAVAFSDWFSLLLGLPEVLGDEENWPLAFAFPGHFFQVSNKIDISMYFCFRFVGINCCDCVTILSGKSKIHIDNTWEAEANVEGP